MALTYQAIHYRDLGKDLLYAVLALRSAVFVVEQRCHYQDLDGYDSVCTHLLAYEGESLFGCARIVPPEVKREQPSIGRYALLPDVRGRGQGRAFFEYAIAQAEVLYPKRSIYIQAQAQLERFYGSMGFVRQGESYMDAGIPHVDMLRHPA